MISFAKLTTLRSLSLLAIAATATAGLAQDAGSWPTFKGTNDRQGYNSQPNTTGPGQAFLTWFDPRPAATDRTILLDNTDFGDTAVNFPGQGPFPAPLNGSDTFSTTYNPLNASPNPGFRWAFPNTDEEASFPFLESIRNRPVGALGINPNSRFPAYLYTQVTQSDPGNVLQGYQPADVRTFQYIFRGAAGVPRNYALSAWLPVGPMYRGGAVVYPQRYFVYDIRWGAAGSQHFIDVVDTYASGGGWVRLGNGGAATNTVFPWDGTTPITVTLYNTVPRDNKGVLTMPYTPNPTAAPNHKEDDVKKYVVYADAMKADPATGTYAASPVSARLVGTDATTTRLYAAKNELTVASDGQSTRTVSQGVVTSYAYEPVNRLWLPNWRYSPSEETQDTNVVRDDEGANVAGTFVTDTTYPRYGGNEDKIAPIQAVADGAVTYDAPGLNNGSYEIFVYLPGDPKDVNGIPIPTFGTRVLYQVTSEGVTSDFYLDQSVGGGWVKIADRRFTVSDNFPTITVVASNQSPLPADQTKIAYADSIRFVGDKNQEIRSTPVFANAQIRKNTGGQPIEDTNVVIIADESGHLHCVDAAGNGDGTTTEYWAYPSTVIPDPNAVAGEDGVGTLAEMPTGFDLSSALVQRVGPNDYLYIGSTNGRVYCINMTGRGDYTRQRAGTTTRRWTYPSTFPSKPEFPTSSLGRIRGSVSFAVTNNGATVFVPTMQGRIYALDARGKSDKSTSVRWAFPAINQTALGPVAMTPTFSQGSLFFGTMRKNDANGRFFRLNASNGAVQWELTPPAGQGADDYLCSPTVVTNRLLTGNNAATGATLFTLNQNQVFSAIDTVTGNILWQTDELLAGSEGALSYTSLMAYNNSGVRTDTKVIMVPTQDGRFSALNANPSPLAVNRYGGRLVWQYVAEGDRLTSSISIANGTMFGADNVGFLYAFSNQPGSYGPGDFVPGSETVVANNPAGDVFRKAKMKLITKSAYQRLRLPLGTAGQLTYPEALDPANSFTRTPLAFEWGETAYILVYDFPYITSDPSNNIVPPPIVNISFSVDGRTVRGIASEARQFPTAGVPALKDVPPPIPAVDNSPAGDRLVDGYAIMAFTFQGGGANALPPGDASINFSISSQALNSNQAQQNVILDPAYAKTPFTMANPLAIVVPEGSSSDGIGLDVNPSGVERLTNGSPGTKTNLSTSTGYVQHGTTGNQVINVYDVSMMGILRPDGGLDGVRVNRSALLRQAGAAGVFKPLNAVLYPNFEDLPVNSPNTSLDYPDIPMDAVRATKEPTGDVENPIFNGVTLIAPLIDDGGVLRKLQEGDDPTKRQFRPTQFQFDVDVPRFQPPVSFATAIPERDTLNNAFLQGYIGRVNVFVDSLQNGNLDINQREAYRAFNLATAVPPDEKLAVTTPSVDLGSMPTGAGYSALARPGYGFNPNSVTQNRIFSPWSGAFANNFKEFNVENQGNVNMLDLRIAKVDNTGARPTPWSFFSNTVSPLAWIEGGWPTGAGELFNGNLWTSMDWQFSPWPQGVNASRNVILQKARVSDNIPSALSVNPMRRPNPNLNADAGPRFDPSRFPVGSPKVSVSVPIGFPSGRYAQHLRVIEQHPVADTFGGSSDPLPSWDRLRGADYAETISDPGFDLFFNVRESRLTTSFTPKGDRMLDEILSPGQTSNVTAYANQQPAAVRDAFGSLIVAFSSNRPGWLYDGSLAADPQSPSTIYIASLDNAWTFTPQGLTAPSGQNPTAPLSDLNNWNSAGTGTWFKKQVQSYPNDNPGTLFNKQAGETILASTLAYRNPSFPQTGMTNPFDTTQIFQSMYMGFVGDVQKQTQTGRVAESRIMVTQLQPTADGVALPNGLVVMQNDPTMQKGKPSVLQTPAGAMVFFTGINAGQTKLYYSQLDANGFGPNNPLPIGTGFELVSNPSAAGHVYRGAPNGILQTNDGIVDLTFAGKLRGRPNAEIFIGRLLARNGQTLAIDGNKVLDANNSFVWQSPQTGERIASEGNGLFRARGVVWNLEADLVLSQTIGTNPSQNLLVDGTRKYDPTTGILSYDTSLGGKVYMDPNLGTIRFANSIPSTNAEIRLNYQPEFLRVTPTGPAGYAAPVGQFDQRIVTETIDANTFWRTRNGGVPGNAGVTWSNDRYVFTYNRAANGVAEQARPFVSTFRFGVQLPYRLNMGQAIGVTGNTGPYQLDPSNGRIYFTAADENRQVQISYSAMTDSGSTFNDIRDRTVAWTAERTDEPLPVEQAVNESGLTSFLDPFAFRDARRPPLMWLFWTSTRTGNPDVYFQTVAPNWSPIPLGQ
jgi:hypothetical protein